MVVISSLRTSGSLRQVWCGCFFIVVFLRNLFGTLVMHPRSISSCQGFRVSDIRFPDSGECINHISIIGCTNRLVKVSGISLYSTRFHLFLLVLFPDLLHFLDQLNCLLQWFPHPQTRLHLLSQVCSPLLLQRGSNVTRRSVDSPSARGSPRLASAP